MSVSPHSANSSKVTRTASPGKETIGKPKVRRSTAYSSDLKTALPGKTLDKLDFYQTRFVEWPLHSRLIREC